MYLRIEHLAWTNGPADAWAAFKIFDDLSERVGLHYDRAPGLAGPADPYAALPRWGWLIGAGPWRLVFPMPGLALRHGQSHWADFRPVARGIAVRAVGVTDEVPPDMRMRQRFRQASR